MYGKPSGQHGQGHRAIVLQRLSLLIAAFFGLTLLAMGGLGGCGTNNSVDPLPKTPTPTPTPTPRPTPPKEPPPGQINIHKFSQMISSATTYRGTVANEDRSHAYVPSNAGDHTLGFPNEWVTADGNNGASLRATFPYLVEITRVKLWDSLKKCHNLRRAILEFIPNDSGNQPPINIDTALPDDGSTPHDVEINNYKVTEVILRLTDFQDKTLNNDESCGNDITPVRAGLGEFQIWGRLTDDSVLDSGRNIAPYAFVTSGSAVRKRLSSSSNRVYTDSGPYRWWFVSDKPGVPAGNGADAGRSWETDHAGTNAHVRLTWPLEGTTKKYHISEITLFDLIGDDEEGKPKPHFTKARLQFADGTVDVTKSATEQFKVISLSPPRVSDYVEVTLVEITTGCGKDCSGPNPIDYTDNSGLREIKVKAELKDPS